MLKSLNLFSFLSKLSLLLFHFLVSLIDALRAFFNFSSCFLKIGFWNFSFFSDCFNFVFKAFNQFLLNLNCFFELLSFLIVKLFWIISFKIFLIEIIYLTSKILISDVKFSYHIVVLDPIFLSFLKFFCLRWKLFVQVFMFDWKWVQFTLKIEDFMGLRKRLLLKIILFWLKTFDLLFKFSLDFI